jgi:hypothetical protein
MAEGSLELKKLKKKAPLNGAFLIIKIKSYSLTSSKSTS